MPIFLRKNKSARTVLSEKDCPCRGREAFQMVSKIVLAPHQIPKSSLFYKKEWHSEIALRLTFIINRVFL